MILVRDLITQIESETDELLDTPTDDIQYLNYAIEAYSLFLNNNNDPALLDTQFIQSGSTLLGTPTPPNGYPILVSGRQVEITDEDISSLEIRIKKFRPDVILTDNLGNQTRENRPLVASDYASDEYTSYIDLPDTHIPALVLIASYLVKKKTYIPAEYLNQDNLFIQTLQGLLSQSQA